MRFLFLDPRTTLLCVLVINVCVVGAAQMWTLLACMAFIAVLLASVVSIRGLAFFFALEVFFLFFAYAGSTLGHSTALAFVMGVSYWMARFVLTGAIGIYALFSLSTSQLPTALRRLWCPANFVSAVMVMVRFVPTVVQEFIAIREAMIMRGVRLSGGGALLHPVSSVRYILIPLVASTIRIADDLTASAAIRGLGGPGTPTSLHPVRLCMSDWVIIIALVGLCGLRVWNPGMSVPTLGGVQ